MSTTMFQHEMKTAADKPPALKRQAWEIIAAGAIVPIGVTIAAAYTCYVSESEKVAMTAWIVAAIVGTSGTISSAVAARRIFEGKSSKADRHQTEVLPGLAE